MKSKSANPREEGMALLFALGFLAMLLVLGLGFVTTSLLSQKLAANNGTRVQARTLARSAAARAALSIMLYDDQAIVNAETLDAVPNYDAIRSYGQVSYNDNGATATGALDDQLKKGSAANAEVSKLKYTGDTFSYQAENNDAKWIYFYDSPSSVTDGRKIIGRVAFQVLPDRSRWLSLYGVAGGAKLKNDCGVIPMEYTGGSLKPFRWGRAVDELNLNPTTALADWSQYADKNKLPSTYDVLYNTYSDFFTADAAKKKKWVEYWFSEGRSTLIKDAFPVEIASGGRIYYNRFNIGDRDGSGGDNWYDRFKKPTDGGHGWDSTAIDGNKNSAAAVDALADDAVAYQENDTDDSKLDAAGIPFLKRIGNEPHSFSSLELLRRQIAANLNDYCDSDSIPTSDKSAATWSLDNAPSYTGNERTLYINEVALKLSDFKVGFSGATLNKPVSGTNRSKIEITSITPTAIAELVNMYDHGDTDTHRDAALLNPANYKLHLALNKLSFEVVVKATFNVKYLYTSGSNTGLSRETNVTVDYGDNATATVNYAPATLAAKEIGGFSGLSAGGYSTGSAALDAIDSASITQPDESIFANKIQSAVNDDLPTGGVLENYTSITVTGIGCRIKTDSAKIGFSNLLLENTSASVGNVDYVRMADAGELTLTGGPFDFTDESASGDEHTFAQSVFAGGIEARDPRQNLNPKSDDPTTSDWNLHPAMAKIDTDGDKSVPSMTIGSGNVTGGLKNQYADPHAPQYVKTDGSTASCPSGQFDVESATDPAWKGESAGQHVSTAYIRNAPMVSPWELGLIHRGREWQTLNLKKAGGFGGSTAIASDEIKNTYDWSTAGTAYDKGDGAILEFVKMTPMCRTMGKIPLKLLSSTEITSNGVDEAYNKDLVKMLFVGIRVEQTMKQFYKETADKTPQGTETITSANIDTLNVATAFTGAVAADLKLRSQFLNTAYGRGGSDDYTFGLATITNDALQEEVIGKTINLLAVNEETPPNVFKVIVVAQTIRDVGGIDADVTISKLHNGTATDLGCRLGRFDFISDSTDWEKNTYYDEITGEVKALVTIERVPSLDEVGNPNTNYGRLIIRKIEYID